MNTKGEYAMAKFNEKNTIKTVNMEGYPAYAMKEKEELLTAVLTTMFGEPKFYGSTDLQIRKLAADMAVKDPAFLAKLTCYTRNEGRLRSPSHVLACEVARHAPQYTHAVIRNSVIRADDITEIMACYKEMYGKPFPNALKRGIAEAMLKFDEYQFAKYSGPGKSVKFRDVLRITHPVPDNKETEELFGKIMNDTLETPYTWETELSEKGNTKDVWNELNASGKMGYMATLRNIRNIVRSGADIEPALEMIADPVKVRRSRQLPFRFYAAYKTLLEDGLMTPEIRNALEKALTASVENVEKIPGRTLIAVDISGSMVNRVSAKSDMRCVEIAALMGAIAQRICEDAAVCYFNSASGTNKGYTIAHYGKYDSILDICAKTAFARGCTNMHLPMVYALTEDKATRPFDRVIYFSDNMCHVSCGGLKTVQSDVDQYREKFNRNFWVHGIDMQGYGTQQFNGAKFNLVAGWNEGVLGFINKAENGFADLIEEISRYEMK